MTTKIDKPETQEVKQPAEATQAPAGTVLRLLLAATAPLLKRAMSSAFAIRLGSMGEIEEVDRGLADPALLEESAEEPGEATRADIVRFDVHQRIQHVLMFTSFIALAFTGLPQKFHTLGVSQWIIMSLGGIEATQGIHRIAAFVMLFDCLYHGVYLAHGIVVKKNINPLRMIPGPKDVTDAIQMFLYFLGFSKKYPKFDRYSYLEKFDYFAVFWGIVIIGGSGLVLMFPVLFTKVLPGQIVPVALVAHSDEALLAVGWIFVVHLFYAHLAPRIFPFNTSIFTGRVSRERYKEEHPLDYRRVLVAEQWRQLEIGGGPQSNPAVSGGAPEATAASEATGVREDASGTSGDIAV